MVSFRPVFFQLVYNARSRLERLRPYMLPYMLPYTLPYKAPATHLACFVLVFELALKKGKLAMALEV